MSIHSTSNRAGCGHVGRASVGLARPAPHRFGWVPVTAGLAVALASVMCKSSVVVDNVERDGGGTGTTTTMGTTPPQTSSSSWTSTSTGTGMGHTSTTSTSTSPYVPLEDWGVSPACSACANQHCSEAAHEFDIDPTYETLELLWACLFGEAGEGACTESCATLVCNSTVDVYETPFTQCNDCQNENCCDERAACEADPACSQCVPLPYSEPSCCDMPLFVAFDACLTGGSQSSCSDVCPYLSLCG